MDLEIKPMRETKKKQRKFRGGLSEDMVSSITLKNAKERFNYGLARQTSVRY